LKCAQILIFDSTDHVNAAALLNSNGHVIKQGTCREKQNTFFNCRGYCALSGGKRTHQPKEDMGGVYS